MYVTKITLGAGSLSLFLNNQSNNIFRYQPSDGNELSVISKIALRRHLFCKCDYFSTLVSIKKNDVNPYYILKEDDRSGFLKSSKKDLFTRRQDCPEVYELNGAIYLINRKSLKKNGFAGFTKIKKYVMDKQSNIYIDSKLTFNR